MAVGHIIVTEQVHARFKSVLENLDREANAKFVFLVDKSGQQIAAVGELDDVDPTSLASLTAGTQAEALIAKIRTEAREGRLSLPKGRKTHLSFAAAANVYLKKLKEVGGKDYTNNRSVRAICGLLHCS